MKEPWSTLTRYIWLFALALLLRVAFAFVSISQFETPYAIRQLSRDTEHYTEAGERLRTECTLQSTGVRLFGPGYPGFLALLSAATGQNTPAMVGLQIVVASAGAVLLALLTFRITGQRRVASLAGFLHAVSLSALGHSVAFMAEALGLVLVLLGFLLLCKATTEDRLRKAAGAGLILGLAIITWSPAVILLLTLPVLTLVNPPEADESWTPTLRRRTPVLAITAAMMLLLPTRWLVHD